MTIEEALVGLKSGKTLRVDRRDCPILPELLQRVESGQLISEFREVDDQYSYIAFRWNSTEAKAS